MASWAVRLYQPGDEIGINDLFNAMFERRRPLAVWQWKFDRNPATKEKVIAVAESDSGKIVGVYASITSCLPFRPIKPFTPSPWKFTRYTTPSDASFVRIEVGTARNGLPMPITLDVDNLDGALDLPQVILIPSGTRFRPGDTLILTVTVTPGATPRTVDAYLAVRLPDGTLFFYPSLTTALQPVLTSWTVAAFSGEVFRYTFTGGEPLGNYAWLAAFTDPGTLNIIGGIA